MIDDRVCIHYVVDRLEDILTITMTLKTQRADMEVHA